MHRFEPYVRPAPHRRGSLRRHHQTSGNPPKAEHEPFTSPVKPPKPKLKSEETSPRAETPKLEDFLYQDSDSEFSPDSFPDAATPAHTTADIIRETRARFIKRNPPGQSDGLCTLLDRSAVLDVYAEALNKLHPGTASCRHYEQILAEANRKVRVVLDIEKVDANDPAFSTLGQQLRPLEPLYAQPRIGTGEDDEYGRMAQWRLDEWRREGWPDVYPAAAIEREARERVIRQTDRVLKDRAMKRMEEQGAYEVPSSIKEEDVKKRRGDDDMTY